MMGCSMLIYLSTWPEEKEKAQKEALDATKYSNRLFSYYYFVCVADPIGNGKDANMKKPIKIFLDSGAYSAWTQRIQIDINDYIEFIKKHREHLEVYANLDVIQDAEATFKNQLIMERAGLSPLPVYHYGSDIKWLKKYLDIGYDYIALGVAGNNTTDKLAPWLDDLFSNYLTDTDGMPIVKVHGFAVTNFSIMLRYPWYSVDSTTWMHIGRTGNVMVPVLRNGECVYDKPPYRVSVSNRSPDLATNPDHITRMPKTVQNLILEYFSSKGYSLGESKWEKKKLDYELQPGERWTDKKADRKKKGFGVIERVITPGLSNDYRKRDELNIIYYADLEKNMPEWPWPFKLKERRGFRL